MTKRLLTLLLAILTGAATLAAPAVAADADAPPRGTSSDEAVAARVVDRPEIDAVVELGCKSRVGADAAAVHCRWRAGDDLGVRRWQLWNLQVRPEKGERNLVAELGADAHGHVDTEVEVPAAYLYAVLGLDGNGEIIARSRIVHVVVAERTDRVEILRLECAAHRGDGASDPATIRDDVAIGCHWSPTTRRTAAGYVLWRSVDGGQRERIARLGLDVVAYRDDAVAAGHRYTYVVQAVDARGHVVASSRPEHVGLRPHAEPVPDREVDRVPDVATDQVSDAVADAVSDVVTDVVTDRATDPATDRATDHVPDVVSEREVDQVTDQATDVVSDREVDRVIEPELDRERDGDRERRRRHRDGQPADADRAS